MTQVPKFFIHAKWTNDLKPYKHSIDDQDREQKQFKIHIVLPLVELPAEETSYN